MCRPQSQTARRGRFKDLKVRGTEELGKNVQNSAEFTIVQYTVQCTAAYCKMYCTVLYITMYLSVLYSVLIHTSKCTIVYCILQFT